MAVGGGANLVDIIIRARDQTKAAFASAKASIAATKTSTGSLNKGLTGLNKGFNAVGSKVSGFGTKLKGLLTSAIGPLIGVAGIAAIGIALNKAVKAFGSFEQAAANASSVTGKTGAAFLETKKHIMDVSKVLGETTVFKASEAADAFYDLASAGYDVANITKTELKPVLDLAAATQTDLKQTTEIVTSTLGQFGMTMSDSKSVADVFARTIGSSKATMDKLGASLTYVGPVAHALGRSLEETNATLGVLYNKGFDASMAGTALRGAMSRLMNPTAQVEAKLSELGVSADDVNPKTRSMADILDTLSGAGMDTADAMEIFGLRAGPAMLALTESTDDIRELTTTLGDAGDAAETMAGQQLTTFEGQMKLVHSKIEAFMLSIGEMTAPAVLAVANFLTDELLPAAQTIFTELGVGFREYYESIYRQIAPTFEPLIAKAKEAGDKMSAGFDFKTLADDWGVFVGAALNPLIRAFTWLIDKLGPLWDLIGRGADIFHGLANALKTEEGRLDDIRDATEGVTAAKQTLYDINEKLREATKTLADEIRDAGGWTESLSALEADAKTKTDALAEARKAATVAIAEHGAGSEIARAAIEKVKLAEDEAKKSTENYQGALDTSAQKFIDAGVATEGLQQAHMDLDTASNDSITAQENLQTAISDLAKEIEESKQAPFDLGEAFGTFGEKVKGIFMELPLRIAEAFVKMYSIVADVFDDLGVKVSEFGESIPGFLGGDMIKGVGESFSGISDNFDTTGDKIEARIDEIRTALKEGLEDPLNDDIPEASKETEQAIEDAANAIVAGAEDASAGVERVKKSVEEVTEATQEYGAESEDAGDQAEQAYKDIELQVGDTEVTIKNLTGELGDNADAFENMQESASKLINLDWSTFTEFEAALPNIEAGIQDMESSFNGLASVLETNIGSLKNVKESVIDISGIAAPFLEAGFLEGIKTIGKFASALKDASSAIDDFSSLQDVSIDGMINFSLHVHDMVSALQILESQMEDLVPAFGEMDTLISDIVGSFIWTPGRKETIADELSRVATAQRQAHQEYEAGLITVEEYNSRLRETGHITDAITNISGASFSTIYDYYLRYIEGTEDIDEVTKDFLNTSGVAEKQMDLQTGALERQTKQLSKITDALQPYLEFMRTLNELAALSTLSTEELNNGLKAINDTLVNLGSALSTFDLRPAMESLFGTKITEGDLEGKFTGGFATPFTDVMFEYATPMNNMIASVTRLSSAIIDLTSAFDALANTGDSVLADQEKLKKVFEDMTLVMSNFTLAMGSEEGEWNFAQKIVDGMDTMLKSAGPLTTYFQNNNAAVTLFSETITGLVSTISSLIDAFQTLQDISPIMLDQIVEGFEKIAMQINEINEGMLKFGGEGIAALANDLIGVESQWALWTAQMGTSMTTFGDASSSITGLTNLVSGLVGAFTSLAEMPMMTADAFSAGMKDMSTNIQNFASALKDNIDTIEKALEDVDEAWSEHAETMNNLVPIFKDATSAINTLAGGVMSAVRSFESLKEIDFEATFTVGFKNLTNAVSGFGDALSDNIDGLIGSLDALVGTWKENEDETVRLMRAFLVISSNFMIVISRANTLQAAFDGMTAETGTLNEGFDELIEFMNGVLKGVEKIYTTDVAEALADFVTDVGLIIDAMATLGNTLTEVMDTIRTKTDVTVNKTKTKVSELGDMTEDAGIWGAELLSSFIAGMHSMATALESEVSYLAGIIFKYLGVGSNTKLGALSHLTDWPRNLTDTFAEGIRKGVPNIKNALSGLKLPVDSLHVPQTYPSLHGGGNNVTLSFTQNIANRTDADHVISEVERILLRKKVL